MKHPNFENVRVRWSLLALSALPFIVAAQTAPTGTPTSTRPPAASAPASSWTGQTPATAPADARARYARESAACSRIAEHGARANCLSEASTRLAATQPPVPGESPEILRQNAVRRCEALPDAERKDCLARMQGQGTVSGSVEGGGVYRELVTREVGVAPKAASAP